MKGGGRGRGGGVAASDSSVVVWVCIIISTGRSDSQPCFLRSNTEQTQVTWAVSNDNSTRMRVHIDSLGQVNAGERTVARVKDTGKIYADVGAFWTAMVSVYCIGILLSRKEKVPDMPFCNLTAFQVGQVGREGPREYYSLVQTSLSKTGTRSLGIEKLLKKETHKGHCNSS